MYLYIYITESLCCTAEINTTLQINYISIKLIFKKDQVSQNFQDNFSFKYLILWSYIQSIVLVTRVLTDRYCRLFSMNEGRKKGEIKRIQDLLNMVVSKLGFLNPLEINESNVFVFLKS